MKQKWMQHPLKIHLKFDPEKRSGKGAKPGRSRTSIRPREDLQFNKMLRRKSTKVNNLKKGTNKGDLP